MHTSLAVKLNRTVEPRHRDRLVKLLGAMKTAEEDSLQRWERDCGTIAIKRMLVDGTGTPENHRLLWNRWLEWLQGSTPDTVFNGTVPLIVAACGSYELEALLRGLSALYPIEENSLTNPFDKEAQIRTRIKGVAQFTLRFELQGISVVPSVVNARKVELVNHGIVATDEIELVPGDKLRSSAPMRPPVELEDLQLVEGFGPRLWELQVKSKTERELDYVIVFNGNMIRLPPVAEILNI